MLKPCLTCGTPSAGPRCPVHRKPSPYSSAEYQAGRAQTLAEEDRCFFCGEPESANDPFTAHHIVEVVSNGSSRRENLAAAHGSCNKSAGARFGNGRGAVG